MNKLSELDVVIRRVVAARVADRHTVEDLVQETLVRVAAHRDRFDSDELQAYAITTARHLVIGHARRQSIHRRHAHRLVDYTSIDGPEQLALDQDETRALAVALEGLDPDERDLLLRYEVDDVSTHQLGEELGVSAGGVAMRLSRARARLRLDFVLAFRRATLPSTHCRSVLLALSAGDPRRQHALHTTEHLITCVTCAELAEPVSQRRRGIAGWLIAPAAALLHRLWSSIRTHPATTLAAVTTASVAIVVVLAGQPGSERDALTAEAAPVDDATSTTVRPAAINPNSSASSDQPTQAEPPPASDPGAMSIEAAPAPSCPPDPLGESDPAAAIGCAVPTAVVTATDIAADEGFLAATDPGVEVWIQLVGSGESPIDVEIGMRVTITGTITATDSSGPPTDERARAIGWYIAVDDADVAAD